MDSSHVFQNITQCIQYLGGEKNSSNQIRTFEKFRNDAPIFSPNQQENIGFKSVHVYCA